MPLAMVLPQSTCLFYMLFIILEEDEHLMTCLSQQQLVKRRFEFSSISLLNGDAQISLRSMPIPHLILRREEHRNMNFVRLGCLVVLDPWMQLMWP